MHPSTLTDQQIQGYRALRRDGVGAATAHRLAITAPDIPPYRIGPDDQITFVLDERPDLAEFTITATSVPDPAPDTSWLGTFHRLGPRGWRPPETIELTDSLGSYFMPAYSLAQRRADLSAHGYARGPAHMLAERGVRDDAQLALDLDCRIVTGRGPQSRSAPRHRVDRHGLQAGRMPGSRASHRRRRSRPDRGSRLRCACQTPRTADRASRLTSELLAAWNTVAHPASAGWATSRPAHHPIKGPQPKPRPTKESTDLSE